MKKHEPWLFEKLRHLGLKLTKQREIICEVFFNQDGHCSAEEILNKARSKDEKVSLATVYRTLKLLQNGGLCKAHNFKDDQALFEPVLNKDEHHDHLICTDCGIIVEFLDPQIELLQMKIAKEQGFDITSHRMELYGRCEKCKKTCDVKVAR